MSPLSFGQIAFDAVWSGLAAVGFAVLFNLPRRYLGAVFTIGALAHAVRSALMSGGFLGIEGATLLAATVLGFSASFAARRAHVPLVAFALPSSIPLVPGALAFKAMLGMLRLVAGSAPPSSALALEATVSGLKTALILVAIVAGVGSPSLVLRHRGGAAWRKS